MVDPLKVDNNPLHVSWCDSTWVPHLNSTNVLNYFMEKSNPFYSRECNNEFIKMQQNARIDALSQMQGTEYMLLHAQDPILYIIRKQQRYNPTHAAPLASYHVIAGQVFQTPDLGSVINNRLGSALININGAFSEMSSFSQYQPSKGYSWHFPNKSQIGTNDQPEKEQKEKKNTAKDEAATFFQRQRVETLITDLVTKFPYKPPPPIAPGDANNNTGDSATANTQAGATVSSASNIQNSTSGPTMGQTSSPVNVKTEDIKQEDSKQDIKLEMKTEIKTGNYNQRSTSKPPPEKRQRLS